MSALIPGKAILPLLLTFGCQVSISLLTFAPPISAAAMMSDLDLPPSAVGLYTGLVYMSAIVSNAWAEPLIGRFGPLRLSFACVALAGAGLLGVATGFVPLVAASTLLMGLCYGPLTPAASLVLAQYSTPNTIGLMISLRQTGVPAGGLAAGLLVPQLTVAYGWSGAFLLIGTGTLMATLILGFSLSLIRNETSTGIAAGPTGLIAPLRFVFGHRTLLSLSAGSLTFSAMQLCLTSFLTVYLVSVVGLDLVTAGVLLGVSQVAGILGRIGWGMAADRVPRPRSLMLILGVLMCASAGATSLLESQWAFMIMALVVFVFGATASGWNGVFLSEIVRTVEPSRIGIATSGCLTFTFLGVVCGPPLFGGLVAMAGYDGAFALMGGIALAGGVVSGGGALLSGSSPSSALAAPEAVAARPASRSE
ncbi:MFS transporter [Microvirga makkahensis]|uniref:MFS transporter n=1 Tax=Microvirga makkahensis TaxID=1128670 RepID=A0A7X3SRD6_9HYPH|nr:MFS transporter [Microvirga makkahensis]